ncbi:serine hydrolase domain-containing protein [Kitasatospora sp. NPDC050543]|uniref:serine hydrolase domain-containing protein n=1 Tax=Kitasatospora sp. NPDC050543 TaxID=3364054 RepID=UPI0037B9FDF2
MTRDTAAGVRTRSRLRRPVGRAAVTVLAGLGLFGAVVPEAGAAVAPPREYRVAAQASTGTGTDPAGADPVDADSAVDASAGADSAALNQALRAIVEQGGSSAALAQVRQDGRVLWRDAAGAADLASGAPASADGRFRIGSVTKTFVATVVLQLVAEHRLALDDPIERHLPGVVPNGGAITVRQLLNHTSGLFNYTEDPSFALDDESAVRDWLKSGRWTAYRPQQLVTLATGHAPYFAPGQGWHYSNTNYILAGMLIQRTTGRSWAEEVERRIIRPLGLKSTSMPVNSPFVPGPHAHGYFKLPDGPADATLLNPSMGGSAGAGISTTADLTRFNAALLGGRLLRPAELAEMKRTVEAGPGYAYGLGLIRYRTSCGELWGHTGGIPGYGTVVAGDAAAHRQLALSYNPYDLSDPDAADRTMGTLVDTAACGATADSAPAHHSLLAPGQLPR